MSVYNIVLPVFLFCFLIHCTLRIHHDITVIWTQTSLHIYIFRHFMSYEWVFANLHDHLQLFKK